MRPFGVAQMREILLGVGEDFALVHAAELGVAVKVLLVQRLKSKSTTCYNFNHVEIKIPNIRKYSNVR